MNKFMKINEENNIYLANLEVDKKDRIKSIVFGYFLALMIVFTPILITAHFFIYNFYYELIVVIITLLLWLLFTLGEVFYHKFLVYFSKNEEKRDLKVTHIMDSLIYLLMCLACSFVVIFLL